MPDNRQSQNPGNAVASSSGAPPENLEEAMWRLNIQDNHDGIDANRCTYPDRPGEPDCSYYMRTGQCGYGSNCRFNHPAHVGRGIHYMGELPERLGQPDCQYFLKTGTCKFGSTCKYNHPRDKLTGLPVQLNMLGLPIRPEEKSCPYYMRTGACKFRFACKFHHPEPTFGPMVPETRNSVYGSSASAVSSPSSFPFVGGVSSWALPRSPYVSTPNMQGLPAFLPVVVPSSQGMLPTQQSWSTYMGAINHPVSSTEAFGAHQIPNIQPQTQPGSSTQVTFPERPDQPDCRYFIKTGSCKYGTSCKYHHPKEKIAQSATSSIGLPMLPSRPGQAVCTYYSTYGSCKYGSACKFDHPYPWPGYYGYTYPALPMWDPSSLFPYQRSSVNWTSSSMPVPENLKVPDALPEPESASKSENLDPNEEEDQPPQAISPSETAPSSGSTQDQSD